MKLQDQYKKHQKPDTVPKGFHTVIEWAKESDLSYSHSYRLLKDLVRDGVFEVRHFRIWVGDKHRILRVPHYGEKK